MRTTLFGALAAACLAATPLTSKPAHAIMLPSTAGMIAAADAVSVAPQNVHYYGYPHYRPWRPHWRPAYHGHYRPWRPYYRPVYYGYQRPYYRPVYHGFHRPYYRPYHGHYRPWRPHYRPVVYGGFRSYGW